MCFFPGAIFGAFVFFLLGVPYRSRVPTSGVTVGEASFIRLIRDCWQPIHVGSSRWADVLDVADSQSQVKIFRTCPGERTAAPPDDDRRRRSKSAVRPRNHGRELTEVGTNLRTRANPDRWRPLMRAFGANRMYNARSGFRGDCLWPMLCCLQHSISRARTPMNSTIGTIWNTFRSAGRSLDLGRANAGSARTSRKFRLRRTISIPSTYCVVRLTDPLPTAIYPCGRSE